MSTSAEPHQPPSAPESGGEPAPAQPSRLNRKVLLLEWAQMAVFDRTATQLKANYIRGRYQVIYLTLISTVAAVGVSVIGLQPLAVLFAGISIALPILASYLMNDIIRFTGTTAWIKYRYTAEVMRMHIFLYRMQAGPYSGPAEDMDNLLAVNMKAAKEEANPYGSGITPRVRAPIQESDIIAAITAANQYTPEDDGLSELTLDQYVSWRLDQQYDWYDFATSRDFVQMRRYTRASQTVLLVGAVVTALAGLINLNIELVVLVAVTNAISVALTSAANVNMFGKTYALFLIAAQKLTALKSEWSTFDNDADFLNPATRGKIIDDFVQRVENTLKWERDEWYELALQAQTTSDKAIMSDLTRLSQRADDEQKATIV